MTRVARGAIKCLQDDRRGCFSVHDLHATMLFLLGIDHIQLTFKFLGRDFRLTDVHGRVVKEILA